MPASELPQWEASPASATRANALYMENQQPSSRRTRREWESQPLPPPPPPPSRLRSLWRGFWALFAFCMACGMLGVEVNTNFWVRRIDRHTLERTGSAAAVTDPVLGLPAPLADARWSDVLKSAKTGSSTVRFASWSDADYGNTINDYIDQRLGTYLRSQYGVLLRRVPLNVTADAVESVTRAAAAGTPGTIDLIWINGKNFKNLSQAGLLYGPFAAQLPNGALFDFSSPSLKYDFGYPTAGYEMPYNVAQFTLIYNAEVVGATPPASMLELIAWIKAHPGKFAYPVPSEDTAFESAALLRHFFGALCPPYSSFFGAFDEGKYMACTNGTRPSFWDQLNQLQSYLWVNSTTGHPPAAGEMDDLFGSGKLAFTFSYDPFKAATAVADGTWNASTTRSYVFTAGNLVGTVANTNFVAIPKNAPNLAAALVAANAIASPAQMFARAHADVWGTFPAYTPGRISEGWEAAFEEIEAVRSINTPQFDTLAAHALGELDAAYGARLEADWARFVAH